VKLDIISRCVVAAVDEAQPVFTLRKFADSNRGISMFLQPLAPYLSVILIILAVTLITLILVQSKGSDLGGFLGGGGDMGSFRTKRGVEATLHNITIGIAVAFFVFTILTFIAWGQAG